MFENKSLSRSKLVIGYDMKPQLDMLNTEGMGQGLRDPLQAAVAMHLNDAERARKACLLKVTSFDVYSVRAALSEVLSDVEMKK
jgi:hypothetical protein